MDVLAVEVWEGALAGERTLSGFAAKQSVPLTRFAYLLCGDHQRAEDLVQDAYLALYRRFGDTLPLAAPVAYARKAIVNAHLSHRRRRASTEQITDTVDAEITGLSEQYRQGGIRRLVIVVDARARRPGSSLYLVTTFKGEALAGNLGVLEILPVDPELRLTGRTLPTQLSGSCISEAGLMVSIYLATTESGLAMADRTPDTKIGVRSRPVTLASWKFIFQKSSAERRNSHFGNSARASLIRRQGRQSHPVIDDVSHELTPIDG